MRILFYYPKTNSPPEPPVGLGILMAIARQLNHEVDFYDHENHDKINLQYLIKEFEPELFAVSCMTPQYYYAQKAFQMIKNMIPSCITIIGGPHASALPIQTIEEMKEIDYLCAGEGEVTFREFLISLDKGKGDLSNIAGLYFRHNRSIIYTKDRALMTCEELDNLPMPAWDILLKRGLYKRKEAYCDKAVPFFSLVTARGCPYECTFCDERSIWKRKVRERIIDNVISEITYLMNEYDAKHFKINDDTFTFKPKRVIEFCEKVKKLNIEYWIVSKVNTITQEMLHYLAESGCKQVGYGVESGDEKVLNIMKKHQTLRTVRKAFEMTNSAGLLSYAFCMVGNIGENFDAVKKTAKFVKEINASLCSVSVMTPYPGSENYKICLNNNWILAKDWSKWCFTPIRIKSWVPVSRTDKMDSHQIVKSYYYLNRCVMFNKFQRNYGKYYFINPSFIAHEIIHRIKVIGLSGFIRHIFRFLKVFLQ